MKNTSQIEALGELVCDCSRVAYLEQTKRRGGFLQVRCAACGVDQRTGESVQSKWREAVKPIGHYKDFSNVAPYGTSSEDMEKYNNSLLIVSEGEDITPQDTKIEDLDITKIGKKATVNRSQIIPIIGFGLVCISIGANAFINELRKV